VQAVLRRTAKPVEDVRVLTFGEAVIDLRRREVRWPGGERADLSETEAEVLAHLAAHRERAVSREELLGRVWGVGASGAETRAVDMHVVRLRAKLRSPEAVVTVRNAGYMAGPDLKPGGGA
jgi:DNA-binding response OmpR family regulator